MLQEEVLHGTTILSEESPGVNNKITTLGGFKMKLRLIICLSLLVLFISPAFANDGIFKDAVYSEAAPFLSTSGPIPDAKIIRARIVRVDFDSFTVSRKAKAEERIFKINLFDDAFFTAIQEKVINNASGSTTWIGKIMEGLGAFISVDRSDSLATTWGVIKSR